jgi:hypothetical protein
MSAIGADLIDKRRACRGFVAPRQEIGFASQFSESSRLFSRLAPSGLVSERWLERRGYQAAAGYFSGVPSALIL